MYEGICYTRQSTHKKGMMKKMKKYGVLTIVFFMLIAVLMACSNNEGTEESTGEVSTSDDTTSEDTEIAEPNLENIPEVVAEVNGQEISKANFETNYRSQYQQAALQAQMSGEEIDQEALKQQVADSMIGQELLIQEANAAGVEASEAEVDDTIQALVEQNQFESEEALIAALEEQGTEESEFMDQVETQVKLDQFITSQSGDLEANEEEMEELYNQLVEQQEQLGESEEESSIPSYEEAKSTLEQQIISQKKSEVVQSLINDLRESADVTNNL